MKPALHQHAHDSLRWAVHGGDRVGAALEEEPTTVYQTSTMSALLAGLYEGTTTIGELLTHGDFGVGTFNGLDGEMVILDGQCHHLHSDGTVTLASDADLTPFAVVANFETDVAFPISGPLSEPELLAKIEDHLVSDNLFFAIRITGEFNAITTRTAARQTKPYPRFVEAARSQVEKTFSNTSGTIAGFRAPDYESGITVAGYHLHFLDSTGTRGGHCLGFEIRSGDVEIAVAHDFHLSVPTAGGFLRTELVDARAADEIAQTEGGGTTS
jgi:acetolactate decarboxylase